VIKAVQLDLVFGQADGRQICADDRRLGFDDRERLRTRAFQVEVELRIRVMGLELIGELQGERRLARPPQALNAQDAHVMVGARGV
jgi:hypothetical protein